MSLKKIIHDFENNDMTPNDFNSLKIHLREIFIYSDECLDTILKYYLLKKSSIKENLKQLIGSFIYRHKNVFLQLNSESFVCLVDLNARKDHFFRYEAWRKLNKNASNVSSRNGGSIRILQFSHRVLILLRYMFRLGKYYKFAKLIARDYEEFFAVLKFFAHFEIDYELGKQLSKISQFKKIGSLSLELYKGFIIGYKLYNPQTIIYTMQHGSDFLQMSGINEDCLSDYHFVWGEVSKRVHESMNKFQSNPIYIRACCLPYPELIKPTVSRQITRILYLSSPFTHRGFDFNKAIIFKLISLSKSSLLDIEIVIRLHPSEKNMFANINVDSYSIIIEYANDKSFDDSTGILGTVVFGFSSSGLTRAVIAGVNSVFIFDRVLEESCLHTAIPYIAFDEFINEINDLASLIYKITLLQPPKIEYLCELLYGDVRDLNCYIL